MPSIIERLTERFGPLTEDNCKKVIAQLSERERDELERELEQQRALLRSFSEEELMSADYPFDNDSDQATRKRVHKDTMHSRAMGDFSLEEAGRFAKQNRVIGTGAPAYPRLPETSPQNQMAAQGNTDAPFPEDISAPVVVGETWEVEASLGHDDAVLPSASRREPEATPQPCTLAGGEAKAGTAPSSRVDVERPRQSIPTATFKRSERRGL